MFVIPAIDIIEGKVVRLSQGNFAQSTIYSSNPVKVAKNFEKKGAKFLHVVDLDGARRGFPANREIIFAIAQSVKIPIQVGGGIRTFEDAEILLKGDVEKIVLGTVTIENQKLLKRLLKEFGEKRIVVSLDLKDGKILIKGWRKKANISIPEVLNFLKKAGVSTLIITDTLRDGLVKGPNFDLISEFIDKGFQIIAAGGISTLADIKEFNKRGTQGVIVGKAVYRGKIDLQEVQRAVEYKNNLVKRIIPCLDCKGWQGKWSVVKGIKFEKLRLAGNPVKLAKKYSKEGVDELAMLDISASLENRKPFFDLVKKVAKVINIPLTVGGGIATLSDIEKLLKAGASKISLNTAIVKNPNFLNQAVKKFGSEKIVVAIDAKKGGKSWKVCILGGTKVTNLDVIKWAKEVKKRGAGALLPTSKDKDGTKEGYDLELLRKLKEATGLPIIASGGAGKKEDFLRAFTKGKADAVLAASLFHFKEIDIKELKRFLVKNNISVRL